MASLNLLKKILVIVLLLSAALLAGVLYISRDYLFAARNPARLPVSATVETAPPLEETTLPEPPETETVAPAEAETTASGETTLPAQTEPQEERVLLTFVGDCTLGCSPTNYYADVGFIKTVGDDYEYPFRNVISWFEEDDATFANLEGPLTDEGGPVVKKHVFHGPESYVDILTRNSVEFVSLANNHTLDYGDTGYQNTLKTLNASEVPYVERDSSVMFTLDRGLKIGVYGVVYYAFDIPDMEREIRSMREQGAQLVIVAAHWGTEGGYTPTAQQREVGKAAIDAGADIVYGTHTHTLQPIEEYNGGIIYYSLGNFAFGGNNNPKDYNTALVQQQVIRNVDGTISLGELTIVPCSISSVTNLNNFQPTPYEEGSAAYEKTMSKLNGTYTGGSLPIN